jgi:hypothetical protein
VITLISNICKTIKNLQGGIANIENRAKINFYEPSKVGITTLKHQDTISKVRGMILKRQDAISKIGSRTLKRQRTISKIGSMTLKRQDTISKIGSIALKLIKILTSLRIPPQRDEANLLFYRLLHSSLTRNDEIIFGFPIQLYRTT